MKKLFALLVVCCLAFTVVASLADEAVGSEDMSIYTDHHPEALPFESAWVAENGNWRIEVFAEDGGMKLMVVHTLGDNKRDVWEYAALMGDNNDLVAVPFGLHYKEDFATGEWDTTYYEDGTATFSLTADGKLLWKDGKEGAGNGLEFQKIGSFYGGRFMKGDIEVIFYGWYDGQYDIRLYQIGENEKILKDAILKGDYDPATNTVKAIGGFDGEEPMEIVFSYDDHYRVVWTENGQSTPLELSYRVD